MSRVSGAVSQLKSSIRAFESNVDASVREVQVSTENIQATTESIYNNVTKFKREMLLNEEKQMAKEQDIRIEQIIREKFSRYEKIRKTVMGVVHDFDINLVRNETIHELSQELWITSSRYWLSYALIAISAWVNDYPDLAKIALSESMRKDPVKTTLFFCLVNLRFARFDAARKWLSEYFSSLDPTMLQEETAILIQSFLYGVFGKSKADEREVAQVIDGWISSLNSYEELSDEIFTAYEKYIDNLNTGVEFNYPSVLKFCKNASEFKTPYKEVAKYKLLLDYVKSLDVDAEVQNNSNYKKRLDKILKDLISNYDEEERELKDKQWRYITIYNNNGDVEAAEAQLQARQEVKDSSFNIGKQMLTWAIYDDNETDVQVRKFGFQHTRLWFKRALDQFEHKLKSSLPLEYKLRIDGWEGSSDGSDEAKQVEDLNRYYRENKLKVLYVNKFNILLTLILIASVALVVVSPYSLIAAALATGLLVFRLIKANRLYPERIQQGLAHLHACMGEIVEFRRYYDENYALREELLSTVDFL